MESRDIREKTDERKAAGSTEPEAGAKKPGASLNFIQAIVEDDLRTRKYRLVQPAVRRYEPDQGRG